MSLMFSKNVLKRSNLLIYKFKGVFPYLRGRNLYVRMYVINDGDDNCFLSKFKVDKITIQKLKDAATFGTNKYFQINPF